MRMRIHHSYWRLLRKCNDRHLHFICLVLLIRINLFTNTMAEQTEEKKDEQRVMKHTYPLIRNSDMNDEMRTEAMELCVTACEKYSSNNERFTEDKSDAATLHYTVATSDSSFMNLTLNTGVNPKQKGAAKMIKDTMDKKFGASWHVVVGEGYGFELTHEVKNILYMYFGGNLAITVWKCS